VAPDVLQCAENDENVLKNLNTDETLGTVYGLETKHT
jgi:hypothetical protein